jgi:hypothetical protein
MNRRTCERPHALLLHRPTISHYPSPEGRYGSAGIKPRDESTHMKAG